MVNYDETHWRDSARPIRFFIWDGKAAFALFFVLIWPRLWTLLIAILVMIFFTFMNRYGYTPIVFFRAIRSFLAGRRVYSAPWWEK